MKKGQVTPYDIILSGDEAKTNEIYSSLRERDFGRDNAYTKEFMNLLQKGFECKNKNKNKNENKMNIEHINSSVTISSNISCEDTFMKHFHNLNAHYPGSV
jgi:hypothetical protein